MMTPARQPAKPLPSVATRTFRWDLVRGFLHGSLEACWQTFAVLVAIRVFHAPEMIKALLPAGFALGLLLTPLTVIVATHGGWRIGKHAAFNYALASLSLACAVFAPGLIVFVVTVVLMQMAIALSTPLITHIYSVNYAENERGKRFSKVFLCSAMVGITVSFAGGKLLDLDLGFYRVIYGAGCLAALLSAVAVLRIPTKPLPRNKARNPWKNLGLAREDKLFGYMLCGWMLMGLGNLMTVPIRVEYAANPDYGLQLGNAEIAILMGVIPMTARLLSTAIWGWLFDRFNLVVIRVALNLVFMVSILLYFLSTSFWSMAAGMACFGVAIGGGPIMWTLWVTKIAPEGMASAYMSVHTAFTGMRGVAAPFLGYALLSLTTPVFVAWCGALLIGFSIILFIPARTAIDRRIAERMVASRGTKNDSSTAE